MLGWGLARIRLRWGYSASDHSKLLMGAVKTFAEITSSRTVGGIYTRVKAEATVEAGIEGKGARVKEGAVMRVRVGARLIEVHVKAGAAT